MTVRMKSLIGAGVLALLSAVAVGAYVMSASGNDDDGGRLAGAPAGGGGVSAICVEGTTDCNDTPGLTGGDEPERSPQAAIDAVKAAYPEFEDYPSDALPPKSIKTELTGEGWYVAFVQEGSGRPVISATCFVVADDLTVGEKRTYAPALTEDSSAEFSPFTCSP